MHVEGLTGAQSVAAANGAAYALLADGTVRAWGANLDGQLGNGVTSFYSLLGDAAVVPDWLKITGYIIEAVAVLLGITIWVHATRTGQQPTTRGMVLAPLSLTQRRRIANQIKGREPVVSEELPVVLAVAGQSLGPSDSLCAFCRPTSCSLWVTCCGLIGASESLSPSSC